MVPLYNPSFHFIFHFLFHLFDSPLLGYTYIPQRVRVPNNWLLGIRVIVIIVQVLGKYMIIGYLDP